MKKQRILKIIYSACFFLICGAVGVSVFFGSRGDFQKQELTPFPSVTNEDGGFNRQFFSSLTDYVSENVAFREEILSLHAKIRRALFGSSVQPQVIIGSDSVLYFDKTVDDYCDNAPMSDRELFIAVHTLESVAQRCRESGTDFVFTVAPNKNTLYPEFMPKRYIKGESSNLERLESRLVGSSVDYLSLKSVFEAEEEMLYYKTDTHWNTMGALRAYNALTEHMKLERESYENVAYEQRTHTGDLEQMLYPYGADGESELYPKYDFNYVYTSRFKSEDDIIITTVNSAAEDSLIMYRDSFGNALLPFLAEAFNEMYYTRSVRIDTTLPEFASADKLVFELVERNLRNLTLYAPVIPARQTGISADYVADFDFQAHFERTGSLLHIYGFVDEKMLASDSLIFISVGGSAYECSLTFEQELMPESENRANGFSVYIDGENISDGDEMRVYVQTDSRVSASKNTAVITKGEG